MPGSQYLGPGDFVDGHQEYNFSAPPSDFGSNGLTSFKFIGLFPNGYRTAGVFNSLHANGRGGIPSPANFEIHEDVLNPASGLFGALGHGIVDYGIGKLNRIGVHVNLDGKC
jgi:hypothetical protein